MAAEIGIGYLLGVYIYGSNTREGMENYSPHILIGTCQSRSAASGLPTQCNVEKLESR